MAQREAQAEATEISDASRLPSGTTYPMIQRSITVGVSYLEIYNANGYDLLDENHASKSLFDLPKV